MECLETILIGKAEALDVPIDSIKEFVEIFNSEVPNLYPNTQIIADINDLERQSDTIRLHWQALNHKGVLNYDIMTRAFNIENN